MVAKMNENVFMNGFSRQSGERKWIQNIFMKVVYEDKVAMKTG